MGELHINCDRLHKFADISALEDFLEGLVERPESALVMELPRQPGAREHRWAHLLSGAIALEEATPFSCSAAAQSAGVTLGEIATLNSNVARLEGEVAAMKDLVARLCAVLGAHPIAEQHTQCVIG